MDPGLQRCRKLDVHLFYDDRRWRHRRPDGSLGQRPLRAHERHRARHGLGLLIVGVWYLPLGPANRIMNKRDHQSWWSLLFIKKRVFVLYKRFAKYLLL